MSTAISVSHAERVRAILECILASERLSDLESLLDAMHSGLTIEEAGEVFYDAVDEARLTKLAALERPAPFCRCGRQQTSGGFCARCDA